MEVSFDFKGDPTGAHITNCKYLTKGGFPIETETQISKLMTYIAKLYVISLLILVSISIGNPPKVPINSIISAAVILNISFFLFSDLLEKVRFLHIFWKRNWS